MKANKKPNNKAMMPIIINYYQLNYLLLNPKNNPKTLEAPIKNPNTANNCLNLYPPINKNIIPTNTKARYNKI